MTPYIILTVCAHLFLTFVSLGATVYFEMELFDKCIQDCDKAIELKKDFSKVTQNSFLTPYIGLLS